MRSLNTIISENLRNELNMAKAKRTALVNSGLPCDKIEERIQVLNAAIVERERISKEDK